MRHPEFESNLIGNKGRMNTIRSVLAAPAAAELTQSQRSVLRVLWLEYAGPTYERADNGQRFAMCWPGNKSIAESVGCAERTVKRALPKLIESGLIEKGRSEGKRLLILIEKHDAERDILSPVYSEAGGHFGPSKGTFCHPQRDTVSPERDIVSAPIRKNRTKNRTNEQNHEQSAVADPSFVIGRSYRRHTGHGAYAHEFASACVRLTTAGRFPNPAAAGEWLANVAGEHWAFVVAHHPKGEDADCDKYVKRLDRWLAGECYDLEPGVVFAHIKPDEQKIGGNADRAMQYIDEVFDAIEPSAQISHRAHRIDATAPEGERRLPARLNTETQQTAPEPVLRQFVDVDSDGRVRRVV